MRILHIVGTLNPAAGGPSEAIRMLVRHAPPGYTSEVACLDPAHSTFLNDVNCPVHPLGGVRLRWFPAKLLPWLRQNQSRFDGILVHGLWQSIGLATLLACSGKTPYIVFAHGMLDPWFKRTYPRKHLKKWLFWLLAEYWVLRRAHHVLFTTPLERDLATRSFFLHHWRPAVVPLGSEPPPTSRSPLQPTFMQQFSKAAEVKYLLYLGRIHPKKGCDLLVQAFAELAPHHPNLHLVIAGPDPANWRAQLEPVLATAGVTHRVHWPGMLTGQAKWGAFAACDAFILPSHQENFGIAAVEALASGKPVLLTHPVNISPDLAAAGCALVESDTLDGTRRLLSRWLTLSAVERQTMSFRALQTFYQQYDMRHNAATILRLFETALQPSTVTLAAASEAI